MTDFESLLRVLIEGEIDFILIGGFAATVHGSARFTQDLDVVYRRSDSNIGVWLARLKKSIPTCAALRPVCRFDSMLEPSGAV